MVDNFIQSVQDATKDAPKSINWYRDKIREFGKPRRVGKPSPFNLNMFVYDPKYKKTLPYYDTFPLVLPLERYSDGFLGLNFQYRPIPLQVRLLDRLNDIPEGNQYSERDKLKVSYARASGIPMARAVIKRYLYSHLKSQMRVITPEEGVIAVLLPVQRFKKASTSKVYNETKKLF